MSRTWALHGNVTRRHGGVPVLSSGLNKLNIFRYLVICHMAARGLPVFLFSCSLNSSNYAKWHYGGLPVDIFSPRIGDLFPQVSFLRLLKMCILGGRRSIQLRAQQCLAAMFCNLHSIHSRGISGNGDHDCLDFAWKRTHGTEQLAALCGLETSFELLAILAMAMWTELVDARAGVMGDSRQRLCPDACVN